MGAAALRGLDPPRLRLSKADVRRACLAGFAWGVATAGVVGIGPIAAYGGRR